MEITNEKLVELIQGGIFPKEHLEQLYLQNEPFINSLITKRGSKQHFDDLKQESYIVLCECAAGFDTSKGYKFVTYYGQALKIMLHKYGVQCAPVHVPLNDYAEVKDNIKSVSLDAPLKASEDGHTTITDTIPDIGSDFEDSVIAAVDMPLLWQICRRLLSSEEYKVIYLHYKNGCTYERIAETLDVNYNRVRTLRNGAIDKLRRSREVQDFDDCIYRHVTLSTFKATWTSSTERAAVYRADMQLGAAVLFDAIHGNRLKETKQ